MFVFQILIEISSQSFRFFWKLQVTIYSKGMLSFTTFKLNKSSRFKSMAKVAEYPATIYFCSLQWSSARSLASLKCCWVSIVSIDHIGCWNQPHSCSVGLIWSILNMEEGAVNSFNRYRYFESHCVEIIQTINIDSSSVPSKLCPKSLLRFKIWKSLTTLIIFNKHRKSHISLHFNQNRAFVSNVNPANKRNQVWNWK